MEMKDRLRSRRLDLGMTLEQVAKLVGTSKQTIHRYETGIISNIPSDKIEALAVALKTTPQHLMGWDESAPAVPLYEAAAGEGIINDSYPSDEVSFRLDADEIVFRVVGRSMEPTIADGDLVIVKAQSIPDHPDQIVLVRINGDESTIKRVNIKPDGLALIGDNPLVYSPHFYTRQEVEELPIRIEGVVTKLIRELG